MAVPASGGAPTAVPAAPRALVAAPTPAAPRTTPPAPPRPTAVPKVVAPVSTNGSGNVFVAAPVQATTPFTASPTATTAPQASSTVVRDVTVVRRRRGWRLAFEWGAVLLVALAVAFGIRTFVVQTFFIPSASMEPTLKIGDRILVDKLSYRLHGVHRGDIVVFGKPPGENDPTITDLVKRVIGLPGDTIASQEGKVYIDGKPLTESYLPAGTVTTGITPQTIPPNEYFVMGDNRSDSQDSRYFGPISKSLIVGRVVVRIWPLSAFHVF